MKVKLPKKIQEFLWSNGSIVQDGDKEYCFLPLYFVKSPNGIEMMHLDHMPNFLSRYMFVLSDYQTDKSKLKSDDIFELDDYTLLPTEQTKDNG